MDLERSALTVLGPATDPATWRAAFERWSPTTAAHDPEPAKDLDR